MTNSGALIFHFGAFSSIWSFFLSHFCRSKFSWPAAGKITWLVIKNGGSDVVRCQATQNIFYCLCFFLVFCLLYLILRKTEQ